jgi:hypothetical protein
MPTAGIGYPSGALVSGNSVRNPILNGYVFNAGINSPEHSAFLTEKYKQFTMTSMLDRIGAYEGIPNDTFSWSVLDRTRLSGTVANLTAGGTTSDTTATLDFSDVVYSGTQLGYFLVDDIVRLDTGDLAKVTATSEASGFQSISITKMGAGNWTATIAASDIIGHAFTAFDEGSTGPSGRIFLPYEEYNYTQIFRRGVKVTGSALNQKSLLNGGKSWYWTAEDKMFEEHAADMERAVMFGVRTSVGNKKTFRGIWDRVVTGGEGQVVNYGAGTGITESDLQSLISSMVREGSSNDIVLLCGSDAMVDIQQALKTYAVNGGVDYGSFGANTAGLDFNTYKFFGKTLLIKYYELFDDVKTLPFVGTPTGTKVNFRHVALALDMGSADEPLMKLKYRDGDGGQRKLIHKVIPGMHGDSSDMGGIAANSFDGWEVQLLSECSLEHRLPNRSGALVGNAA